MSIRTSLLGLLALAGTLSAQTKVEKIIPTKATGNGITYFLPKTSFIVNAEVTKKTVKAGQFYRYAERYLGEKDIATEDYVSYELGRVTVINKGIPDPENAFKIEFRQKTVAPFVYLTSDGLLCAINEEYVPEKPEESAIPEQKKAPTQPISSVFTEELLMAGSAPRQAEIAAKQIYRLRESRTDILTGEADNLPPDGDALKLVISKLDEQIETLTQLFIGMETYETSYFDMSIVPEEALEKEVLFRFSSKLGILEADDLGGEPIYMNLTPLAGIPALDPKEAEKKMKEMKGVVYNVPSQANLEIVRNNKTILKKVVDVVQFGTQDVLLPVMLDDKKDAYKVLFHPDLGAIKKISK